MDDKAQYPRLIPVQLPRGGGKTYIAQGWLWQTVHESISAKKLLIADRHIDSVRLFLMGMSAGLSSWNTARCEASIFVGWSGLDIQLNGAATQRDEFRLRGQRYDAAVCENIDTWPLVRQDPSDPNSPMISVLMEEILAYTHGPVLCTFTDRVGLAAKMFPAPAPCRCTDVPLAGALETLEAA